MTTQRSADIVTGLFLAVIGVIVVIAAFDLKSAFGERLPPRTLPVSMGLGTVITGILLSVRAYFYKGDELLDDWPDRAGWVRLVVTFLSLVGYLILIEFLSVAVASLVFSVFLIYYLDRKLVRALCVGVFTALLIEVVFVRMLQLSFPPGFWVR